MPPLKETEMADIKKEIKMYMTIPALAEATGIPANRIRLASKGEYRNKICVGGATSKGKTTYIKTKPFLDLWDKGKL